MESVARYAALVCYSEFGGCPLLGSIKCTASMGIAVVTSTVVRYSEEVRYWEGPLSEVPLYYVFCWNAHVIIIIIIIIIIIDYSHIPIRHKKEKEKRRYKKL